MALFPFTISHCQPVSQWKAIYTASLPLPTRMRRMRSCMRSCLSFPIFTWVYASLYLRRASITELPLLPPPLPLPTHCSSQPGFCVFSIFSRVHVTLYATMSVSPSVRPSIRQKSLCFFRCLELKGDQIWVTAPAQLLYPLCCRVYGLVL